MRLLTGLRQGRALRQAQGERRWMPGRSSQRTEVDSVGSSPSTSAGRTEGGFRSARGQMNWVPLWPRPFDKLRASGGWIPVRAESARRWIAFGPSPHGGDSVRPSRHGGGFRSGRVCTEVAFALANSAQRSIPIPFGPSPHGEAIPFWSGPHGGESCSGRVGTEVDPFWPSSHGRGFRSGQVRTEVDPVLAGSAGGSVLAEPAQGWLPFWPSPHRGGFRSGPVRTGVASVLAQSAWRGFRSGRARTEGDSVRAEPVEALSRHRS